MKKLFLIRHGETEANRNKILQGQKSGFYLSNLGKKQVKSLAERLQVEQIDIVLSSDLERAKETTAEITLYHDCEVVYLPELRERSFGVLEGKLWDSVQKDMDKSALPFWEYKPAEGESITELIARGSDFLLDIRERYLGKNVLVSAHGGLNRAIITNLLDLSIQDWGSLEQNNTCVNSFEFSAEKQVLNYSLNCTKHLDGA